MKKENCNCFNYPADWKPKKIGDLGMIVGGGTPSTSVWAYWGGKIQWFTPAEINSAGKYICFSERTITEDGLENSSAKILPIGTILLTTRASIGMKSILKVEACTNQGFQSIIVNNENYNEFVYYLLDTVKKEMVSLASGSTFLELSPQKLSSIDVVVPLYDEQVAIASVLSDVDVLLRELGELIAKKKAIKMGMMQELLTVEAVPGKEGAFRPKRRLEGFEGDWVESDLQDICDVLDNRRQPLNDSQRISGIYPYCGANGIVDYINRYEFDEPLILIAEDGGNFFDFATRPIAYKMDGKYFVNNHAHVLKAKSSYCQNFVFYQLVHKDITDFISGGTRAKLTRGQLNVISIVHPSSKTEQTAIAEVLSDMDAEIAALEAKRAKYEQVKNGMMQELLTGKIRLV